MRFAFAFTFLAVQFLVVGYIIKAPWGFVMLYPAFSFLLVAAAYAGLGARVFGKRGDGSIGLHHRLLLGPFFLMLHAAWGLARRMSTEACSHRITRNMYLGRRPFKEEVPEDVEHLVDLTAEFSPAPGVLEGRTYELLPTLDATPPNQAEFLSMVRRVAESPRVTFVHCAQGHGRSAVFVAAVLMVQGEVTGLVSAERFLREKRPGIGFSPSQRRFLIQIAEELGLPGDRIE